MKKTKRVISVLFALILSVSSAVTVVSAEENENNSAEASYVSEENFSDNENSILDDITSSGLDTSEKMETENSLSDDDASEEVSISPENETSEEMNSSSSENEFSETEDDLLLNDFDGEIIISGSCGETATYKLVQNGTGYDKYYTLIISGSGDMTNYTKKNDYTGLTNAPWKDYVDGIRSIVISDDITKIGACAFSGLYNASGGTHLLPSGLKEIGDYAFYKSGIRNNIVLPDTITSIGEGAFMSCQFSTLKLPENLSYLGAYAFDSNGHSVAKGDLVIPPNLKYIPELAFSGHSFDGTLTLPASLTTGIGPGAFKGTDFSKIVIGCTRATLWSTTSSGQDVEPFWNMDNLQEVVFTDGIPGWTTNSPWAINKDNVERITISQGITYIPASAFRDCGNSGCTISIPDTVVSIDKYAFTGFVGNGVAVPPYLADAGKLAFAFYCCPALKGTVTVPETLTTNLNLGGCTNVTKVINNSDKTVQLPTIPGFIWIDESDRELGAITSISKGTAMLADEESLSTEIATIRFDANGGTQVSTVIRKTVGKAYGELPVTNIDGYFFLGWFTEKEGGHKIEETSIISSMGEQTLYAHWELNPDGDLYSGTCGTGLTWAIKGSGTLVISGTGAISGYSVNNAPWYPHKDLFNKVIINDGVTAIGSSDFYGCNNIESIELPDSLLSLGEACFNGCNKIKNFVIPDNVTEIGKIAFRWCSGLESISLPEGLLSISDRAFEGCNGLKEINIPASVNSYGSYVFISCTALTGINVDESNAILSSDGGVLFNKNKTVLKQYPLGNSSKTYTISNPVQKVEKHAFQHSMNLTRIIVSDSVTELEECAFAYCESLESVILPNNFSALPAGLVESCPKLKMFVIPDGVVNIGATCFYGCSSLKKVIVPSSVTNIDEYRVFMLCPNVVFYCCNDYVETYARTNKIEYIRTDKTFCSEPAANISQDDPVRPGTRVFFYTSTADASIYYTENDEIGMSVNSTNGIPFSRAISINANTNIYAVAVHPYFQNSPVVKFTYSVTDEAPYKYAAENPVFSKISGSELKSGSRVTLSTETNGASIYYTLDGSIPNKMNGILYEDAIIITEPITIKAIAIKNDYMDSDIVTAAYALKDESTDWGEIAAEDRSLYMNANEVPNALWIAGVSDMPYTGKAITFPDMRVYYHKHLLVSEKDYTAKYDSNTKAGTAKVTITGKGNYSDAIVRSFRISPLSLGDGKNNNADLKVLDITLGYTGKVQKGTTVVSFLIDGSYVSLKSGTDFTYQYLDDYDYKTCGNHYVIIKGKGNYTGSAKFKETIDPNSKLISKMRLLKMPNMAADGTTLKPDVTLMDGDYRLVKGFDYDLEWQNNVNPGNATVIIYGKNAYAGSRITSFKIAAIPISKATVSGIVSRPYTGLKTSQSGYVLTYKADKNAAPGTLIEGKDFTVSYANEINVGKNATIIFSGINKYEGILKKTYTINPYDLTDGNVSPSTIGAVPYQKNGTTPAITVTVNGRELVKGIDYSLDYKNNKAKNDGTDLRSLPTVTIKGKGNYKGTITKTFTIEGSSLAETAMTASDIVYAPKAGICKPQITLYDSNNVKLVAGTDYDSKNIEYSYARDISVTHMDKYKNVTIEEKEENTAVDMKNDIIPVGAEIRATVHGIGNYAGTEKSAIFRFVKTDISKAAVKVNAQGYTGDEIMPLKEDLVLTVGSGKDAVVLRKIDYEIVDYSTNVNKGKATITIRGLGEYGGTKIINFVINAKSMNYTIVFDKNSDGATGVMKNASMSEGKALPANAYKWQDHSFIGWSYTPDGNIVFADKGKFSDPTGRYGRTITLYAIWL